MPNGVHGNGANGGDMVRRCLYPASVIIVTSFILGSLGFFFRHTLLPTHALQQQRYEQQEKQHDKEAIATKEFRTEARNAFKNLDKTVVVLSNVAKAVERIEKSK